MEITISEEYLAHVCRLVDSGRYPSADAVIARALGLLEERDLADTDPAIEKELADIRAKVMLGVGDLRNGRFTRYELQGATGGGCQETRNRASRAASREVCPNTDGPAVMALYFLSHSAQRELDDIWDFFSDNVSNDEANRQIERILDHFDLLVKYPHLGRPRPEFLPDIRSHIPSIHSLVLHLGRPDRNIARCPRQPRYYEALRRRSLIP